MEITTLCAVVASLRVVPSRSQFFQYESVSLSCEVLGNSSEWRIKRNTDNTINENCPSRNGKNRSECIINDIYPHDSGLYWCESESGERSNTVNITVTGGSVILESPAHALTEGDSVTLRCKTKNSSNLTTNFYKDELLVGSSSTGNMTIHSVSKSDEGLYKCNISGVGQSADSRLNVRETRRPETRDTPLIYILLPVVGVCLMLISLMLLFLRRRLKGKVEAAVSYTDVTITEGVKPQKINDEEEATSTFYSTIQLGAT